LREKSQKNTEYNALYRLPLLIAWSLVTHRAEAAAGRQTGGMRPRVPIFVVRGELSVSYTKLFRILARERRAVTALEYGIIAGLLGLALIKIFSAFGGTLSALFSKIGSSI
jgi:Flp pilus assembly pilin Flp